MSHDILLVDDDDSFSDTLARAFLDRGVSVLQARTAGEAISMIGSPQGSSLKLIILDLGMSSPDLPSELHASVLSEGNRRTGLAIARLIRATGATVRLLGMSVLEPDDEVERWFKDNGDGFLVKGRTGLRTLTRLALRIIGRGESLRSFIVHGHDNPTVLQLKDFLQNDLGLSKPIVLRDEPGLGRLILEKLEYAAEDVDIVFAVLTPDDLGAASASSGQQQRRARQNVIFELGYFLGLLGRRSGRVLLLYKGPLELPSDIAGLIYIDIASGLDMAHERIRRELRSL